MLLSLIKRLPEPNRVCTSLPSILIQAPKLALKPLNLVPEVAQQKLLSTVLTQVLSTALNNDELAFLQGNWLHVDVSDVPFHFYVTVDEHNHLVVKKSHEQEANVCFIGESTYLLQLMSRNVDPDTLFFSVNYL